LHSLYAKLTVVQLFGSLQGFRKVGRTYMMLCPFHPDTNASFAVPANGHYFHCFGCGAKGDWVKYVMQKDGLSFREAKHKLELIAKGA
jgi:DNA primase